jgi:protein-tyrosine phosphatase
MKLLMVCTGNICRSPTAEGVVRMLAQRHGLDVTVDSAGTHDYHVGNAPDRRAVAHARGRGYDIAALRARQVCAADFAEFDLLLAMDRGHYAHLRALSPPAHLAKVRLFLDFAGLRNADVPDPYYGGAEGFERVLDMIEAAAGGLVDHLRDPAKPYLSRVST